MSGSLKQSRKPKTNGRKRAAKPRGGSKRKSRPESRTFIVGVGASAGGLETLRPLVRVLPANAGIALVVAQHLSPQHTSMLVELVGRETELTVCEVADGIEPQAGTIYITPPNNDVLMRDGRLRLRAPSPMVAPKPSIDLLFSSLAEDQGENAIGVILSGTGSDGAHGVRAIKAGGGVVVVQDPETAKYDGMPCAALDTGCADHVLNPSQIGQELESIARFPRVKAQEAASGAGHDALGEILRQLRLHTGIDFSQYKRTTLNRRLERRLAANRLDSVEAYLQHIRSKPAELDLLCKDILISVTSFFRDSEVFERLRAVVGHVCEGKKEGEPIRVWVPGCATGEEAYSIAILLCEHLGERAKLHPIQIFATDVDMDAMAVARRGVYPHSSLESLDQDVVERYFASVDQHWQVKKPLRDMMVFARQDLTRDPPFVRIDLLSCRNVLIYFGAELQARVLESFGYAMNEGGYLFLGKSESISLGGDLFQTYDPRAKLFVRSGPATRLPPVGARNGPTTQIAASQGALTIRRRDPLSQQVIDAALPPSVVVDSGFAAIRLFGDLGGFLSLPRGNPDFNVDRLINPAFGHDLRVLVHAASKGEPARGRVREVAIGGEARTVYLKVAPLPENPEAGERLFLVSFVAAEDPARAPVVESAATSREAQIEHELTATREHLQTVVEELETSNEELQLANEELQASNEELQASNEELETSNEELNSTNEELTTVNQELHIRTGQLTEANADLENIQNAIDLPMVVLDSQLRITRFTPAARTLFTIGPSDIGQQITSLPTSLPIGDIRRRIQAVMETGSPDRDTFDVDGRVYRMNLLAYRDLDQRITGALMLFVDQTDVLAATRRAEAILKAKSDFLTNMSHELRTPLGAIIGYADLLLQAKRPEMSPSFVSGIENIRNSSEHVIGLLNDVLYLSRAEAGKLRPEPSKVDIGEIVASAVSMLKNQADYVGISLVSTVSGDTVPSVWADPMMLMRVVINLLSNAIKFSDRGGAVEISVSGEGEVLSLCVADGGIGMSREQIERVMRPFEQVDGAMAHVPTDGSGVAGAGLGIPIVQSLVSLHGGELKFESSPGEGTRAVVVLPCGRNRSAAE